MTGRKRKPKIGYAELLKGGAETPPPPPAPSREPPPEVLPPETPPELPPARPVTVPDEPPRPESSAPARAPRRRAADNAESPLQLASALNERETFERARRGEAVAPDEAPGAAEPPPAAGDAEVPAGDTLELAVDEALQALPFRERVRARAGRAELLLFRVGRELFATPLAAIEEAVELEEIRAIPEMPPSMLGVTDLRGRMIPIYSPARTLGVELGAAPAAALVVRAEERRVALAVDDVEDVLDADLATLREAPGGDDADGVLVGIVRQGRTLVAVLDGEALVAACLTDRVPEIA